MAIYTPTGQLKEMAIETLRNTAAWSAQDGLLLVRVKCSECSREYSEALGTAITNLSGGFGHVCIKCDRWADM